MVASGVTPRRMARRPGGQRIGQVVLPSSDCAWRSSGPEERTCRAPGLGNRGSAEASPTAGSSLEIVPDTLDVLSGDNPPNTPAIVCAGISLRSVVLMRSEVEIDQSPMLERRPEASRMGSPAEAGFLLPTVRFDDLAAATSEAERVSPILFEARAHTSVLGENVALTEGLAWLRELNYKRLENAPEGALLEHLRRFVNHRRPSAPRRKAKGHLFPRGRIRRTATVLSLAWRN